MKKEKIRNIICLGMVSAFITSCWLFPSDNSEKKDDDIFVELVDDAVINVPVSSQPVESETPVFLSKPSLENKVPVYISDEQYTAYNDGYAVTSDIEYKGKPILSVKPKKNGLEITKYHDPIWYSVDILIYNVSEGHQNARIVTKEDDNKNEAADTYFYPFVERGNLYKVYIIKQDKGYINWQSFENNAVYVFAEGGMGDFAISSKGYDYDKKTATIVFDELVFIFPEQVKNNGVVSGGIYDGPLWNGDSRWPWGYKFKDSALCLNDKDDVKKFITGKNKVSVSLHYDYNYYNSDYGKTFEYAFTFVEGTVYDSNFDSSKSIYLSGGKTIPNVYITSGNGWGDSTTHHFGDDWVSASMRIDGCDLEYELDETSIYIKDRGNSTKWTGKTPFSIKLDSKKQLLGMKKAKRWVLMANYFDRSLIRTEFASYLGNNVFNSYWNASFKPVNLYINERFVGTYDLGECNKIAKQRVNVQSLEDYADKSSDYDDVNGDGKIDINDAGFIVEIDTNTNWGKELDKNNYKTDVGINNAAERIFFYSSEYCIPFTLKEPDFDSWKYSDDECRKYGKYAKSKIDAFEKMLKRRDFNGKFIDYIDPVSFIDWYLINEFSKNSDANFQKSVPVTYNPETGKLYMGPNWDFDLAFGNFSDTNCDDPTGWYINGGKKWVAENDLYVEKNGTYVQSWWINRLMECNSFKKAVKARWNDRKLYLKNAINEQICNYANVINDSIPMNEENLPRLGQYEWNGPSGYALRTTYEDEIYYLYNWCMARYNWMDAEINRW